MNELISTQCAFWSGQGVSGGHRHYEAVGKTAQHRPDRFPWTKNVISVVVGRRGRLAITVWDEPGQKRKEAPWAPALPRMAIQARDEVSALSRSSR